MLKMDDCTCYFCRLKPKIFSLGTVKLKSSSVSTIPPPTVSPPPPPPPSTTSTTVTTPTKISIQDIDDYWDDTKNNIYVKDDSIEGLIIDPLKNIQYQLTNNNVYTSNITNTPPPPPPSPPPPQPVPTATAITSIRTMFPTPVQLTQSDFGLPIPPSVAILLLSSSDEINNISNRRISSKLIIQNGSTISTISYGLYLFDGNNDITLDITAKTLQPNQVDTFEVSWNKSRVKIPSDISYAIIHTMLTGVNGDNLNVLTYNFISDSMKTRIVVD